MNTNASCLQMSALLPLQFSNLSYRTKHQNKIIPKSLLRSVYVYGLQLSGIILGQKHKKFSKWKIIYQSVDKSNPFGIKNNGILNYIFV